MFEMLMYRWVQEWRWTTVGRRYGSFSLQFVGKSREISQADLEINSKLSKDGEIFLHFYYMLWSLFILSFD